MLRNKGSKAASKALQYSGFKNFQELTLFDFAFGLGAIVKEGHIDGSEGRIVFEENEAIITIKDSITIEGKKNFVLAHELGHYIMHKNLAPLFCDNDKTLNEWYQKGIHEQEANDFAVELLMPSEQFRHHCKGKKLDFQLIKELSDYYKTSLTATLLRYRDLGEYPIAIIYIENGKVQWKQFSDDFILQWLPKGSDVRPGTVAYDVAINKLPPENEPELVDAIDWFPEDNNIERYQDWKFHEFCIPVSKNGLVAFLWGY